MFSVMFSQLPVSHPCFLLCVALLLLLILTQLDVQEVDQGPVYGEPPPAGHSVQGVGEPRLLVPPPGRVPLVVALGVVPGPVLGDVHVTEGAALPCPDPLGSLDHEVGLTHAHKELVILQTPAPVLVTHPVQLGEHLARDEEDAPDEGGVVILGMEPGPGQMKRTTLGILVKKIRVRRKKVHVMHRDVVTVDVRFSKPNIDQIGAIEPEIRFSFI